MKDRSQKAMVIICMVLAFCTGVFVTTAIKVEKVHYIHKNKCDGICIDYREAYGIEEGLDDIYYYVDKINSADTTNPWTDYIKNKCEYINKQIQK